MCIHIYIIYYIYIYNLKRKTWKLNMFWVLRCFKSVFTTVFYHLFGGTISRSSVPIAPFRFWLSSQKRPWGPVRWSLASCCQHDALAVRPSKRQNSHDEPLIFRDLKWGVSRVKFPWLPWPLFVHFFEDSNQRSPDCKSCPGCKMSLVGGFKPSQKY